MQSLLIRASGISVDSVLVSFWKDEPFYKFVYQNSAYSSITIIVNYSIIEEKLTILDTQQIARVQDQPNLRSNQNISPCEHETTQTRLKSKIIQIPGCLVQNKNVCTQCDYRYYLSNGTCKSIPLECKIFNKSSLECEGCYSAFYLDRNKICQRANYLCRTSNDIGNCLTCYKNYRLGVNGKCIYIA
jgi:hypothetical protein